MKPDPDEWSPPVTLPQPSSRLVTPTRFIGRRRELATLGALIAARRVCTVHGPGGIGKTRLALEVLGHLDEPLRGNVIPVDLGGIGEPALLPTAVAAAVGLNPTADDALDTVCAHLAQRRAVLLLDGCEHLAGAVAELAGEIVARCPGVHVLATSRHTLGVDGEATFGVPPLGAAPAASDGEAVALFVDRARAVDPGFTPTPQTTPVIAEICARLDGVPLSVELAAARTRALSVEQILDRLTDPIALLTDPRRSGRRDSLRASIEWSFQLCTPAERELWVVLSRFAGSFDIDAVEGICGALPGLRYRGALIDGIQSLTEKSILVAETVAGTMRYRLLDAMRAYCRDLDLPAPVAEAFTSAYVEWYAGRTRDLEERWVYDGQARRLARVELDLPAIRTAIGWCLDGRAPAHHLYALVLMPTSQLWWTAGHVDEGLLWIDRILAQITDPGELRSRALRNAVTLRAAKGDFAAIGPMQAEIAELEPGLPDTERRPGAAAYVTAFAHLLVRDYAATLTLLRAERPPADPAALRPLDFQLLQLTATAAHGCGDDDAASRACDELETLAAGTGDEYYRACAHYFRALGRLDAGDVDAADALLRASLTVAQDFPNRPENPDALLAAALVADVRGDTERAEVLSGAAAATAYTVVALTEAYLTGHPGSSLPARVHRLTAAESPARAAGARMAPAEAIRYALADDRRPAGPATALTRRELQVAHLVAEGLSDRQIAEVLVVSQRTAEGHVSRILRKLGLRSRTQIADHLP
ncbi:ATP-binding protein [Gordonia sp. FQ]|uniref:ATP-binding protein n=1 Tax=Gordonia sp. FQ TaxID=3446634 RepID=UPI003F866237